MIKRKVLGIAALCGAALVASGMAGPAAAEDGKTSYHRAQWHPVHFQPAIDETKDEKCLECHQEILDRTTHKSEAGLKPGQTIAWYQTLDTYKGGQKTFHQRHIQGDFAQKVMDLDCNFCHRGNNPRTAAPDPDKVKGPMDPDPTGGKKVTFTLRKAVDASETCLLCHGDFPNERMQGVSGPWSKVRKTFEPEGKKNGCLTCHKQLYRTNRHNVNYLKADNIEKLAKGNSDVCYGCHGGRQWYRNSYPYPRHPWDGMKQNVPQTPDWAKDRPTKSKPRHRLESSKGGSGDGQGQG